MCVQATTRARPTTAAATANAHATTTRDPRHVATAQLAFPTTERRAANVCGACVSVCVCVCVRACVRVCHDDLIFVWCHVCLICVWCGVCGCERASSVCLPVCAMFLEVWGPDFVPRARRCELQQYTELPMRNATWTTESFGCKAPKCRTTRRARSLAWIRQSAGA